MKIKILDRKQIDGQQSWFLGKISLWDYLSAVEPNNYEFEVQRGIVKNRYLDSILDSIHRREVIPPITITTNELEFAEDNYITIESGKFNILDGLQRTYRLWLYKKLFEISISNKDLFGECSVHTIVSELKTAEYYFPGVISIAQIKEILDTNNPINIDIIPHIYMDFDIYLYIWSNLNEKETVNKMLILNAGQRKVSINHQYELMFLQVLKDMHIPDTISLIREKDLKYGAIRRGNREIGEYIFSSAIIGIQSLIEGRPIRLSPDNIEIGVEDNYISKDKVDKFFNQPFLNIYLNSLIDLDTSLNKYGDEYKKWFVKDTTISGLMGAIGSKLKEVSLDYSDKYREEIKSLCKKIDMLDCFNIQDFYIEYNLLSSTKINIGDKVRDAIFKYSKALIEEKNISWKDAFNSK